MLVSDVKTTVDVCSIWNVLIPYYLTEYWNSQAPANSIDQDQTLQYAVFGLGLHCLPLINQFLDSPLIHQFSDSSIGNKRDLLVFRFYEKYGNK